MAGRFVLGLTTGLGGSFCLLQLTTDRRIIAFSRPFYDENKDASIYQYKLYREMWQESRPHKEGEFEKQAKGTWNKGVQGFADGLSTVTGTIAQALPSFVNNGDKK